MNNIQKRFLLFLFGCIGMRVLLVILAYKIPKKHLVTMGYFSLLPAFGFIYIYFTNSRKTGGEVFGDKIWWNHLRPLHSGLYFLFAINAIQKKRESWKFLALDVLIGFVAFLNYHFKKGNLIKLIK
jgi:hypothetical protein|tara:strand:+ start:809 stop:1186 length:378 start_codon:yes stop_codon:yes gene_type:complete